LPDDDHPRQQLRNSAECDTRSQHYGKDEDSGGEKIAQRRAPEKQHADDNQCGRDNRHIHHAGHKGRIAFHHLRRLADEQGGNDDHDEPDQREHYAGDDEVDTRAPSALI
jgi:hypothetical protein